jgi:hypothetical protein
MNLSAAILGEDLDIVMSCQTVRGSLIPPLVAISVRWKMSENKHLVLMANLSDQSIDGFQLSNRECDELIWHEGPANTESTMKPWSVRWSFECEAR